MVAEPGKGDGASWTAGDQREFFAENEQYEKIVNLSRGAYFEHLRKFNGPAHEVLKKTFTVDESLGFVEGNYKEVDARKLLITEHHMAAIKVHVQTYRGW